jgi:hypothetical protein
MEDQPLQGSWLGEVGSEAPPPFMIEGNLAVPCEAVGLELLFKDIRMRLRT